jgi:hypothetical protein
MGNMTTNTWRAITRGKMSLNVLRLIPTSFAGLWLKVLSNPSHQKNAVDP